MHDSIVEERKKHSPLFSSFHSWGESSNRYHDFIPAKGPFRRLRRSICTNDHEDHIQDTKSNHNLKIR
jgi:hypothetical protein